MLPDPPPSIGAGARLRIAGILVDTSTREMWPTLSPDASMVAYGAVAPGLSLLRSRSSRRRRWRPGR
jgi:hypothetical protein